jgi:hypothetical protein
MFLYSTVVNTLMGRYSFILLAVAGLFSPFHHLKGPIFVFIGYCHGWCQFLLMSLTQVGRVILSCISCDVIISRLVLSHRHFHNHGMPMYRCQLLSTLEWFRRSNIRHLCCVKSIRTASVLSSPYASVQFLLL